MSSWAFIFLHNHIEFLGDEAFMRVTQMLTAHALDLTSHWSPVVRSMYLHFIVFRVLHRAKGSTRGHGPTPTSAGNTWPGPACDFGGAFRAALESLPDSDAAAECRGKAQSLTSAGRMHYGRAARRQWEEVEAKYRVWTYQHEDAHAHRLSIDVLLDGGDGDVDAVMADDW